MSNLYVIADPHFGHKNVLTFEAKHRPFTTIEEHDRELISRWNGTVSKRDTVWVLGDVCFSKDSFALLEQLQGYKKLVLGNHDTYPAELYLRYFTKIISGFIKNGCLFTHIPIHPSQFRKHRLNIHGHLHSGTIEGDERYVCVSAEHTNLTPLLFMEIPGYN